MERRWIALAAWLTLLVGGLARVARADDFETGYAALGKQTVVALQGLADWCGTTKLYAERDKALEALLRFDPDNESAHRALKHSRNRDGSWVVPEKKVEARNYNPGQLDDCAKRRAEVAKGFREGGLALLKPLEAKAQRAARKRFLDDLLAIDSEDEDSRLLAGERKRDGAWVLVESVWAKERRGEIKEIIQKAVADSAEAVPIQPDEQESGLGIAWASGFATPKLRVMSTGAEAEARRVAIQCTAAIAVFRSLMGAEREPEAGFTIYLLTTPAGRDAFIAKWPGWQDWQRKELKTWAGAGVPDDIHQARWDADEARRLDGAVRTTLGLMTLINYEFDHKKCAWAWEGVGLYLTRELVGTRYTWYSTAPTSGDADSKELLGKLMMTDVNWMNECLQRAKRNKVPPLAKLCERKIDQFGVDDVLTSYAFAAFLFEAREEELGPVLARISADGSAKALTEVLGIELAELDKLWVRWLGERK